MRRRFTLQMEACRSPHTHACDGCEREYRCGCPNVEPLPILTEADLAAFQIRIHFCPSCQSSLTGAVEIVR